MRKLVEFRFVIVSRSGEEEQILRVACASRDDAIDSAEVFAEDAASVELWLNQEMIWSSASIAPPLVS